MDLTKRTFVTRGALGLAALGTTAAVHARPATASEDRLTALERGLARQQGAHDVSNLISRYELYLQLGYLHEALDLFAMNTPDVKADCGWGVYEGPKSIRTLYLDVHKRLIGDRREPQTLKPGAYYVLTNTSSVIEVAGDGRTAKGLWICPGFSTPSNGKGEAHAIWGYAKRAVDFIREGDAWKIWHYQVYGIFYTPFEKAWTDSNNVKNLDFSWLPREMQPDRVTTTARDAMYAVDRAVPAVPLPPVPYRTFAETFPYL